MFSRYHPDVCQVPTQRGRHQRRQLASYCLRRCDNQLHCAQKSMFQSSLSTFVRATGQYGHPAHPSRLVAPTALAGGASSSSRLPSDVIELSDSEDELQASTALRSERERDVCTTLRGVEVPPGWSVIGGSLLVWAHLSPAPSAQIAAFDFDDTLAKTALGGFDPNAWTNLFPHVPAMLPVETPRPLLRQRLTAAHKGRVDSQPRPHAARGAEPYSRSSETLAGEAEPALASAHRDEPRLPHTRRRCCGGCTPTAARSW